MYGRRVSFARESDVEIANFVAAGALAHVISRKAVELSLDRTAE